LTDCLEPSNIIVRVWDEMNGQRRDGREGREESKGGKEYKQRDELHHGD
jgi:hypothetical protein